MRRSRPAPDASSAERARPVRVLIVDDHRVFAGALGARLQTEDAYEVVGIATSSREALALLRATRPDVVLLDFRLGDETCLEILAEVEVSAGQQLALVVSGVDDVRHVVAGLAAGARAWVRKDTAYTELLVAMDKVLGDGVWISEPMVGPVVRELLDRVVTRRRPRSFVDELTARQVEVLSLLLGGSTRTEIAAQLVVSPHTVRTHIQQLLRRSGSSSTLELLAKARVAGAPSRSLPDPPQPAQP